MEHPRLLAQSRLVEPVIVAYWCVYWLLNGLDKFLVRRDLMAFTWFGKDRTLQFARYFQRVDRLDLRDGWMLEILYSVGLWELTLSLFFLAACAYCLHPGGRRGRLVHAAPLGLFFAALTFIGFSALDVIIGDRAELMEHNIFLGMVMLSWAIIIWLRGRENLYP